MIPRSAVNEVIELLVPENQKVEVIREMNRLPYLEITKVLCVCVCVCVCVCE